MAEQHRATDSEWYCVKTRTSSSKSDVVAYSCILELRDRIKALEAPQSGSIDLSHLSDAGREKILKLLANPDRFEVMEVAQPAKPDSSLERRVSEHIRAHSVITAALVKRLEALEGVPLDGAVPAKVPGGLPALAEKVKALEDTVNATTQPNHPEIPDSSLVERVATAIHPNVCADPNLYLHEARAAIREVAAWLLKNYGGQTATTDLLEQEAER